MGINSFYFDWLTQLAWSFYSGDPETSMIAMMKILSPDNRWYVCEREYVHTFPAWVHGGVELIVEIWLIQIAEGFKLQLSVLEKA